VQRAGGSVTVNLQTNKLLGINVATYMARTELEVPSLNVEVDVVNTGYRKMM
jgi:hypothetical protein